MGNVLGIVLDNIWGYLAWLWGHLEDPGPGGLAGAALEPGGGQELGAGAGRRRRRHLRTVDWSRPGGRLLRNSAGGWSNQRTGRLVRKRR